MILYNSELCTYTIGIYIKLGLKTKMFKMYRNLYFCQLRKVRFKLCNTCRQMSYLDILCAGFEVGYFPDRWIQPTHPVWWKDLYGSHCLSLPGWYPRILPQLKMWLIHVSVSVVSWMKTVTFPKIYILGRSSKIFKCQLYGIYSRPTI